MLTVAMSTAASVTLDDPGTRLVDFDELFEVLDAEEGERDGSLVVDVVDRQAPVLGLHSKGDIR